MHRLRSISGRKAFLKDHRFWLIILTIGIALMKLAIIPNPWPELPPSKCMESPLETGCALIFDEAHYIPAVRKMLKGLAVNNEHPPLSKALMILGILIFGDNPYGWRTLITLSGALSIYLLGEIAYQLTGSKKLSLLAASFFAFDISSFNLSSIAMLDAPALMFSLLSALLFLRRRWILSGLVMGLALLSKTSSLFILAALLIYKLFERAYHVDRIDDALRKWVFIFERVAFAALAVMLAGLAIYDYSLNAYDTPFEHLDYILNYHSSLTFKEGDIVYMPLTWTNPFDQFPRMPYYAVSIEVDGKKYHTIAYFGLQTPLWWMTWLVIGYQLYTAYLDLRDKRFPSFELFTLTWIAANYLIYFPLAHIVRRWVYPFYFYMTVPVIALAFPRILEGERISELMLYIMLGAQVLWFIIWFPVKPQWLIDFLLTLNLAI